MNDICVYHATLPYCNDEEEEFDCSIKINTAILALKRHGGGPVILNVQQRYSRNFDVKELPPVNKIERYSYADLLLQKMPALPEGKIAVWVGNHRKMDGRLTQAIDDFCQANNAVVFTDQTSGYGGKFRLNYALAETQTYAAKEKPELTQSNRHPTCQNNLVDSTPHSGLPQELSKKRFPHDGRCSRAVLRLTKSRAIRETVYIFFEKAAFFIFPGLEKSCFQGYSKIEKEAAEPIKAEVKQAANHKVDLYSRLLRLGVLVFLFIDGTRRVTDAGRQDGGPTQIVINNYMDRETKGR